MSHLPEFHGFRDLLPISPKVVDINLPQTIKRVIFEIGILISIKSFFIILTYHQYYNLKFSFLRGKTIKLWETSIVNKPCSKRISAHGIYENKLTKQFKWQMESLPMFQVSFCILSPFMKIYFTSFNATFIFTNILIILQSLRMQVLYN